MDYGDLTDLTDDERAYIDAGKNARARARRIQVVQQRRDRGKPGAPVGPLAWPAWLKLLDIEPPALNSRGLRNVVSKVIAAVADGKVTRDEGREIIQAITVLVYDSATEPKGGDDA